MKKAFLLALFLVLAMIVSSCSVKAVDTPSPDSGKATESESAAPEQTAKDETTPVPAAEQATDSASPDPSPSPTPEATPSPEPSESAQPDTVFSNDIFTSNMEALDSYSRRTKTITSAEGYDPTEGTVSCAYVKNPLSSLEILDYPSPEGSGSYIEDIFIGTTWYSLSQKDGEWTKYEDVTSDPPLSYKYNIRTQGYPIDYGKLSWQPAGTEQVNGRNCTKYDVSASYSTEFSYASDTELYPITLSLTGNIWVADDLPTGPVMVSQRITVDTDITMKDVSGKELHVITKDVIEDDITDINTTKIDPPI